MANEKQNANSAVNKLPTGIGRDSSGGPLVDPTENVKALQEASNKRQDDLREASDKFNALQTNCAKELREQHEKSDIQLHEIEERYNSLLRAADSRRIDEQAALRADYNDKLSVAEAKRIDAIRAVDVNAVSVAAERSAAQATVLANQVSQSADTLRTLVASTAATVAQGQQALAQALGDRITKLEQAQYTGAGRALIADPQIEALLQQMKALATVQASSSGAKQGVSSLGSIVIGAALVISATIGAITFFSRPSVTPTVQYVPAPTVNVPAVAPTQR